MKILLQSRCCTQLQGLAAAGLGTAPFLLCQPERWSDHRYWWGHQQGPGLAVGVDCLLANLQRSSSNFSIDISSDEADAVICETQLMAAF